MGVYDPLTAFLKDYPDNSWTTSFAEIERINQRPLPRSAYDYRPWWANQKGNNHSQARAWQDAGFETSDVDLARKTVRFERRSAAVRETRAPFAAGPASPDIEALFRTAMTLTGETDRTKLMGRALGLLIRQESADFVAAIGGSEPDATQPPRRSFP